MTYNILNDFRGNFDRRVWSIRRDIMQVFTAVVEKCLSTGLYVVFVPGFSGAHTQGETLDEFNKNLKEVIEMLLEDGTPKFETESIGTQTVMVA